MQRKTYFRVNGFCPKRPRAPSHQTARRIRALLPMTVPIESEASIPEDDPCRGRRYVIEWETANRLRLKVGLPVKAGDIVVCEHMGEIAGEE